MSLRRINYLTSRNILPFNFGMDYNDWAKLYTTIPSLVGSDPATWTPELIEEVNRRAKEENELHDRLMALSDDDFYTEVERLAKLNENNSQTT